MKRRSREINIFSMSALDLFASALGAFILIAIVLFPFFPNIGSSPEKVAELRAALSEAREQLQTCSAELAQTRAQLEAAQNDLQQAREQAQRCEEELRKKFVLVVISWGSSDDVDLHVIDPQGNEFYYRERSHPGTEAKLEEDNTQGPGNEIWLHPRATPGEYRIHYKLYRKRSSSVSVRGAMLTPNGRQPISTHRLDRQGQKPLIATITVDEEGNATLQAR